MDKVEKRKRITEQQKRSDLKCGRKNLSMKLKFETIDQINLYCLENSLTKQQFMELALAKLKSCL